MRPKRNLQRQKEQEILVMFGPSKADNVVVLFDIFAVSFGILAYFTSNMPYAELQNYQYAVCRAPENLVDHMPICLVRGRHAYIHICDQPGYLGSPTLIVRHRMCSKHLSVR
jgi:hypothetical protein